MCSERRGEMKRGEENKERKGDIRRGKEKRGEMGREVER